MGPAGVRAVSVGALGLTTSGLISASAAMSTLLTWDCPIRTALGIQCPGCGSTRCVQAIVVGDLLGAFRHNALTSSAIALTLGLAGAGVVNPSALVAGLKRARQHAGHVILAVLIGAAAFTIIRNIV